jgi:hypothetical protein
MRKILLALLAIFIFKCAVSQSSPSSVVNYSQGPNSVGNPVIPARSNPLKSLGTPENVDVDNGSNLNFFSLGFGGTILLEISPFPVTPNTKITIFETTFGYQCNIYPEECEIYAGKDTSQLIFIGTSCGNDGMSLSTPLVIDTIKFFRVTDTSNPSDFSNFSEPADGYDLDGIEIQNFNPLAIHLGSFSVVYNDQNVEIEIVTLSESTSWKIQVLVSENLLEWRNLTEFPSYGNTSMPTRYYGEVFFQPIENITYFRVSEIDLDGEASLYDPVSVVTKLRGPVESFDLAGRKTNTGNFLIRKK